MPSVSSLPPEALYRRCDPATLGFHTTEELPDIGDFIGQDRAIKAIEFGIGMSRHGYNIFALGTSGTGKHALTQRYVERQAATEAPPNDWCYVNNFEQPYRPRVLRLPAGMGKTLRSDVGHLIEELRTALSSAFENEEYQTRRRALELELQEQQQKSLEALQEQAREKGLTLLRTPTGLVFAPYKDGNVIPPEQFDALPKEEQDRLKAELEVLQERLQKVLVQVPRIERELRSRINLLNQEISGFVLNELMDDLYQKYSEQAVVVNFLQALQKDVSENLTNFVAAEEKPEEQAVTVLPNGATASPLLRRYSVNLLVDSSDLTGAPVVNETNPSYLNLVGRVEQMASMGALITDFTLIKPGALHRANGGYLILDALKVLGSPYAWEGLKRALQFGEIRIESPVQMMNMSTTVSLEPEPIPLDVKVVLIGDRQSYYALAQYDPDFNELFKVAADFGDELVRTPESELLYAQLIATVTRREKLRPFDQSAVARVIEQSARMVSDAERLSTRFQVVVDLMEESDYWAQQAQASVVSAAHVQQAIDAQIYRSDRVRERTQEEILRETILVDTEGTKVGQINGLSVLQLGTYMFGQPSRITATVHMGEGDVINIEREVNMSGAIHAKGVLILAALLRNRYATKRPLALSASLVFEQSYGGVDGDSASSTELYALLSAIAELPINQALAVTGSVNQHGQVQAIGGVNEKIEGFFDLCKARGLTGDQGVLIPIANVKHLMVRQDIVDAAAAGQFHIYPITTIDEGIEVLTGVPAGVPNARGTYPKGTVNYLVEQRLQEFAKRRAALDRESGKQPSTRREKKETKS